MKYTLKFLHPAEQLITVEIETHSPRENPRFFLPKWRPGRYELQNYAQYIADVSATDDQNQPLKVSKCETHVWEVEAPEGSLVRLTYHYYANQPDAGGSFFDADQIYVNGINLLMYLPELIDAPCSLRLELPADYELAMPLPCKDGHYLASDFHELVDSPFLAGPDLIHHRFEVAGIDTHLWFQGVCRPDLSRIQHDISAYTRAQIALFGDCPVNTYHYLIRMLPHSYRHGVEHQQCTLIVMGPGYALMQPEKYQSFLEICSHELFHTWNVKFLRPADMWPYRYEGENYSRLHYITEGVTTYYGDLMIWKAGLWTWEQWVEHINENLNYHYQKGGKDFVSLEAASFNSWTDGYNKPGTPNRKISFYTKGALVAMLMDAEIRRSTQDRHSLDDVLFDMYQHIAKAGRGYTAADFEACLARYSPLDWPAFFEQYIAGTASLEPLLEQLGEYVGLELCQLPFLSLAEARLGMRCTVENGRSTIEHLMPHCPALRAGMSLEDELVSINGLKISDNLDELLLMLEEEPQWEFHYFHQGRLRHCVLPNDHNYLARVPQFRSLSEPAAEQLRHRKAWQASRVAMSSQI